MTDKHTPDEERRFREAALDRTIENTFPASDPLSSDPNPDDEGELTRGEKAQSVHPTEGTADNRQG